MAITKTDVFDFLIDIVPRDDVKGSKKEGVNFSSPFLSARPSLKPCPI